MALAHARRRRDKYIPALKYRWLSPLYDPVIRSAFRDETMKRSLVTQASVKAGHRVLDLGCGTGTLAIRIKRDQPDAFVVGLDGDPAILRIAQRKAMAAGVEVHWDRGLAHELPYPDRSFDAVFASLVLHHLSRANKVGALREVQRVLRPGGFFHVAEFGRPQNGLMAALAKVGGLLEETSDGVDGRLPEMFRTAGLSDVQEARRFMSPLGTISLYRAGAPP